jgi:anti-anti-sigma factor
MCIEVVHDKLLWVFPSELNIYHAAELKQELNEMLGSEWPVTFDLSKVEEIDCAGIQLILVAQREFAHRQISFEVVGHSSVSLNAFQTMGVALPMEHTHES